MTIPSLYLFFFTATSTTEIYTLSLHDALPISPPRRRRERARRGPAGPPLRPPRRGARPGRGDDDRGGARPLDRGSAHCPGSPRQSRKRRYSVKLPLYRCRKTWYTV